MCRDIREISNICFTKHDHQLVKKVFLIIYNANKVRKSRNLSRCRVIACRGCGKKFRSFRASCDVRCLKPRHLRHMWRCLGFRHRTSQLARKHLNFLPQPLHAMTRHLDKFCDFRTSFAFYIIKKHFFNKLVVMFRETDVRNFTNVPAHGLKIHSKT